MIFVDNKSYIFEVRPYLSRPWIW